MSPRQLVQKLWSYCNVLRDDGVSTLDYIQQLTFLLFLKMADEQTNSPWNKPSPVPAGLDWPSLLSKSGDELEAHYIHVLRELGTQPGLLGQIFLKAQNKIQDPARSRCRRVRSSGCVGICSRRSASRLSNNARSSPTT